MTIADALLIMFSVTVIPGRIFSGTAPGRPGAKTLPGMTTSEKQSRPASAGRLCSWEANRTLSSLVNRRSRNVSPTSRALLTAEGWLRAAVVLAPYSHRSIAATKYSNQWSRACSGI